MRKSVMAVAAVGLLYSGYWWVGSASIGSGAMSVVEDLRQRGWTVTYDTLDNRGYPQKFDLALTGLDVRSPDGSFGWLAPDVAVATPSYLPTSVELTLPDSQTLILPGQNLAITGSDLQISASVTPRTTLPLAGVSAFGATLQAQSDAGWSGSLGFLTASFLAVEPGGQTYGVLVTLTDLALPDGLVGLIDPENTLPGVIGLLQLDAMLGFDRPLDRFAGETTGPLIQSIDLREARIVWGGTEIGASGNLTIDSAGAASGLITLTAQNWQQLIEMAVNAGFLAPGAAPTWTAMANAMAQGSDLLTAPITFSDGQMSLGPIPLGPAPRF